MKSINLMVKGPGSVTKMLLDDMPVQGLSSSPEAQKLVASTMTATQTAAANFIASMTDMLGAKVTKGINDLEHKVTASIDKYMSRLKASTVIPLAAWLITRIPAFGTVLQKRYTIMRMLTLMINESGLKHDATSSKDAKGRYAYGLLQHRDPNWQHNISTFWNTPAGKYVMMSGLYNSVANIVKVPITHLKNPTNYRAPGNMDIMQLTPIVAQMFSIQSAINADYSYKNGKWIPAKTAIAQSANWKMIEKRFIKLLSLYEGGMMVLTTLIHTNGRGWYKQPKLSHLDRIKQDAQTYARLIIDFKLWDEVVKGIEKWDKAAGFESGDPLSSKVLTTSKGTKYYQTDPSGTGALLKKGKAFSASRGSLKTVHGSHTSKGHFGVDVPGTNKPRPIYALTDAKVIGLGNDGDKVGRGKFIILQHTKGLANGWKSKYYHLSAVSPEITRGSTITKGSTFAITGGTGDVTGPHLHFEIVNPSGINRNPEASDVPLDYTKLV